MPTIREKVSGAYKADAHPGLWLDVAMPDCAAKEGAKAEHIESIASKPLGDGLKKRYEFAYEARLRALESFHGMVADGKTLLYQAKFDGRLVVDLGAESVIETNCAKIKTYGLPYLPGSSLKGMASHFAAKNLIDEKWNCQFNSDGKLINQGESHRILFGAHTDAPDDEQMAGCVVFHDAWWIPSSNSPYRLDIMTPHHGNYNLEGKDWPADWEQPVPVPFLTVVGTFLVALSGPPAWVAEAAKILKFALEQEGLGAKTQVGYGRISPKGGWKEKESRANQQAEMFRRKLRDAEAALVNDAWKACKDGKLIGDYKPQRFEEYLPLHERYPSWETGKGLSQQTNIGPENLKKLWRWSQGKPLEEPNVVQSPALQPVVEDLKSFAALKAKAASAGEDMSKLDNIPSDAEEFFSALAKSKGFTRRALAAKALELVKTNNEFKEKRKDSKMDLYSIREAREV